MSSSSALKAIVGLRLAVGAAAFAAPDTAGRLFGLAPERNPQSSYLGRLFGARDVALAAGALASGGQARRRWLTIGVAVDGADLAAALLARREGVIGTATTALLVAAPVSAIVTGAAALRAG